MEYGLRVYGGMGVCDWVLLSTSVFSHKVVVVSNCVVYLGAIGPLVQCVFMLAIWIFLFCTRMSSEITQLNSEGFIYNMFLRQTSFLAVGR